MLDILTGSPKEIACGERKLLVGALKLRELGQLQRWIRDHAVRPSARLKEQLEIFPEEEHRRLRYEAAVAERNWPPGVSSAQGRTILLEDPDGQIYFLAVFLRKFQPDLSDEVIQEIAGGLSEVDYWTLFQIAFGEDDLDPKVARAEVLERLKMIQEAIQNPEPAEQTDAPLNEAEQTG